MFNLLSLKRNLAFYIVLGTLTLSFIVSTMLVRVFYNIFTRAFYTVSAVWAGVLFLLFFSLIIYYLIRLFWKISPKTSGIVILVTVLILTIYSVINAQMLYTKTVEIPEFPEKLKAVHLTDIHTGTIHNSGFLKRIVDKTNALEPDVIFITGDLVSGGSKLRPEMLDEFKNFKAPVYFVNGNHEGYEGIKEVRELLDEAGVKTLNDEIAEFKRVQIIGIDYSMEKNYPNKVFQKLDVKEKPSIMLLHVPSRIKYPDVDLIVSGHTHAGQIFPFTLFIRMTTPYVKGLYELERGHIYVSPGTCTWGPPMRLGSKNEITFLKLG